MNIDQVTVDAVNAVMAKTGIRAMYRNGGLGVPVLDADDVSALITALAACTPVAGLVEAATYSREEFDRIDKLTPWSNIEPQWWLAWSEASRRTSTALAPFAKGGA